MNWSKDALLAKAKVFFGKACGEDMDSTYFGMYNALGLELLSRAALAKFSPALLADPSSTENLLYALGLKDVGGKQKSIMMNRVIALCAELIPDFNKDLQQVVTLMTERRNEELHTGGGGFAEYDVDKWLAGFYKACQVLGASMGETLETMFGREVATEAKKIMEQDSENIKKEVLDKISRRKKTYLEDMEMRPDEMNELLTFSKTTVMRKTHEGYHKVECPCCGNDAIVYGKESITSHDAIEDDVVVVKKDVMASSFQCEVCKLRLTSYAELKVAGLPLHYTNTYYYDPTEYFDIDIDALREAEYMEEYSNE